ncbi:MAG: dual specificity protein phosphatase family protein [Gammaproteobacteria bacterium]|nr:dual specificity protein phosphatase family protein [Gammaproteobacteria bacterium]
MINFSQILPQLFIGSQPRSEVDVGVLKRAGIGAVLNLQTDKDFIDWGIDWNQLEQHYAQQAIAVSRVPILDFNPVDLSAKLVSAAEELDRMLTPHQRVYLHCTAGIGRAPTVAIAYLSWHRDMELDEAHTLVTEARSCAPSVDAIRLANAELKLKLHSK